MVGLSLLVDAKPSRSAESPHDEWLAQRESTMHRFARTVVQSLFTILALVACMPSLGLGATGVSFTITMAKDVAATPQSGRLVVSLVREGGKIGSDKPALDAPFWDEAQPLFGVDVTDLSPGAPVTICDRTPCSGCGFRTDELAPGTYRVAARLITTREDSNWRRSAGNLFTDESTFTHSKDAKTAPAPISLVLNHKTAEALPKLPPGVEIFEIESKLLTKFRGRVAKHRVGVLFPMKFEKDREYAAIYEVPGFGGNHLDIVGLAMERARRTGSAGDGTESSAAAAREVLAHNAFYFMLNPESPNGHTLFADSANNGPCGRALIDELIPALEAKYPLLRKASSRLLRGHSSGGWSTLWLATEYPETFGAAWPSSPDPVDFRALETVNIYSDGNMYNPSAGKSDTTKEAVVGRNGDFSSFRKGSEPVMTIRQENAGEEACGPDNTSAGQWDSWQAVWGPRNAAGHPAALFDAATGTIDRSVAEQYRAYDIADRLRKDPSRFAPLFRDRIHFVVGDLDSFYLERAVKLLKEDLDRLAPPKESDRGYIKIVPGRDHGSVFGSQELKKFPAEMLEQLKREGHVK
jgi:hypothetical protein